MKNDLTSLYASWLDSGSALPETVEHIYAYVEQDPDSKRGLISTFLGGNFESYAHRMRKSSNAALRAEWLREASPEEIRDFVLNEPDDVIDDLVETSDSIRLERTALHYALWERQKTVAQRLQMLRSMREFPKKIWMTWFTEQLQSDNPFEGHADDADALVIEIFSFNGSDYSWSEATRENFHMRVLECLHSNYQWSPRRTSTQIELLQEYLTADTEGVTLLSLEEAVELLLLNPGNGGLWAEDSFHGELSALLLEKSAPRSAERKALLDYRATRLVNRKPELNGTEKAQVLEAIAKGEVSYSMSSAVPFSGFDDPDSLWSKIAKSPNLTYEAVLGLLTDPPEREAVYSPKELAFVLDGRDRSNLLQLYRQFWDALKDLSVQRSCSNRVLNMCEEIAKRVPHDEMLDYLKNLTSHGPDLRAGSYLLRHSTPQLFKELLLATDAVTVFSANVDMREVALEMTQAVMVEPSHWEVFTSISEGYLGTYGELLEACVSV